MNVSDWASTIYAYTFVAGGVSTAIWYAFRHGVHTLIEQHITELKEELLPMKELKNNGGSSVKDKVDMMEKRQERLEERVDQIYLLLIEGKK
jgi:hypothetical protein